MSNKNQLTKKIFNTKFEKKNYLFFSSYTDYTNNFIKVNSSIQSTKYEIKFFLNDVYNIRCSSIHSNNLFRKEFKKKKNYINKKIN